MKKQIQKLLSSIKSYNPEKVILFGSGATGDIKEDSDLDVLIIKKTRESYWKRQKKIANIITCDFNVDAFVLTPREIEKALDQVNPFIYDIVNSGKVIYEKA